MSNVTQHIWKNQNLVIKFKNLLKGYYTFWFYPKSKDKILPPKCLLRMICLASGHDLVWLFSWYWWRWFWPLEKVSDSFGPFHPWLEPIFPHSMGSVTQVQNLSTDGCLHDLPRSLLWPPPHSALGRGICSTKINLLVGWIKCTILRARNGALAQQKLKN